MGLPPPPRAAYSADMLFLQDDLRIRSAAWPTCGRGGRRADRHAEEYAKKNNKSWQHTRNKLVIPHLIPRWGKIDAKSITRADVRALMSRIEAPILANQVKAAASAILRIWW